MRTHIDRMDLFLVLIFYPTTDQSLCKDIALEEELTIFLEGGEGKRQRARQARHALQFLRRQIIDIFIERLARIYLVLYAVKTGHQHGCKGYVGIAARVRR